MLRPRLPAALLVALVTLLLYRVPATSRTRLFDDHQFLEADLRLAAPGRLLELWTSPLHSPAHLPDPEGELPQGARYYRPLPLLTMAFPPLPVPERTPWLHLGNALLHLAAALMLLAWGAPRFGEVPALLGALAFATHPAGAEAVAWISGRMDLLALVLGLLALGLAERGGGSLPWASLALFLAALSKETALAFLPLFLLIGGRQGAAPRTLAAGLSLILYLGSRALALGGVPSVSGGVPLDLSAPLASFPEYLAHLVWPLDLRWFGAPPGAEEAPVLARLAGLAGLLGLAGCAARRDAHEARLALALVVLPLVPASGIVPLPFPLSDRYLYPSLAGFALAWMLALSRGTAGLRVVAILVLFGQALALDLRTRDWRDEETMLRRLVGQPASRAIDRRHLVEHLLDQGKPAEAGREAEAGLAAFPEDAPLALLLGRAQAASGDPEGALATYRRIPDGSSRGYLARVNEAALLRRVGRRDEARTLLDRILAVRPGEAPARVMRAQLAIEDGDPAAAGAHLEAALAAAPRNPEARFELALLRVGQARLGEAARLLAALASDFPTVARYPGALAEVLARSGDRQGAAEAAARARQLETYGRSGPGQ